MAGLSAPRPALVLLLLVTECCTAFIMQPTFRHAPSALRPRQVHDARQVLCMAADEERTADGVPSACRRAVIWSAAFALLAPAAASAATAGSVFVGRYTDPKHPGGYREITLVPGAQIGPYMLANVHGGQGTGEPESFDLPAFIAEKKDFQRITIDFSTPPKYGPPDFKGVWDPKQRGIRFYDDGNFWPKQKGK